MISKLDNNDPLKPVHFHKFDEEGRSNLRIVCRDHIPRRIRSAKHKAIFATRVRTRPRPFAQSYCSVLRRSFDEDIRLLSEKHRFLPTGYNYHFPVTKHPSRRDFIINWPEIIGRDVSNRSPAAAPKTPKTRDHDARFEFAKSIGLSALPPTSDESFGQLYGLFDTIMKSDSEHDSVETIRRIRRE